MVIIHSSKGNANIQTLKSVCTEIIPEKEFEYAIGFPIG